MIMNTTIGGDFMKTIGKKIKELRRSKGFSQSDVAEKLGVTSQAVSKWETDSSLPEMTMLPDIASLFGVQIDDLFEYSRNLKMRRDFFLANRKRILQIMMLFLCLRIFTATRQRP